MTRSPTSPTPARLTLEEAALQSGLSYGRVYRRVVRNAEIPSQRDSTGRYTIAAADVHLLQPYVATVDTRPGCTIKTNPEEWKRWERLAGEAGLSVRQWLSGLARAVAGDGRKKAGKRKGK